MDNLRRFWVWATNFLIFFVVVVVVVVVAVVVVVVVVVAVVVVFFLVVVVVVVVVVGKFLVVLRLEVAMVSPGVGLCDLAWVGFGWIHDVSGGVLKFMIKNGGVTSFQLVFSRGFLLHDKDVKISEVTCISTLKVWFLQKHCFVLYLKFRLSRHGDYFVLCR